MDQWVHLTATVDTTAGTAACYVNGKVARAHRFPPGENLIAPGSARIANWVPHDADRFSRKRALRCRIDELAIWSRTLTVDEITEHYRAGRPESVPLALE